MSEDRQALLRELSIERAAPAVTGGGRGGVALWQVLVLMVLTGAGFVGGFLPALRAASLPVTDALRER